MPKYIIRGRRLELTDDYDTSDPEEFIVLKARTDDLAHHRMETAYPHLSDKELFKKIK